MPGARRRTGTAPHKRPLFEVRKSTIHGHGVFAFRTIRTGTRIVEYLGERVSPEEAEVRYDDMRADPAHVLIFAVDKRTVIDAGRGGNEARFINHSCAPNCEAVLDEGRVFIESLRKIEPGEELTYDYNLSYEGRIDSTVKALHRCRCGVDTCRGTMLAPRPKRAAGRGRSRGRGRGGKSAVGKGRSHHG